MATTAITSAIAKTDRLKSFINTEDKEPAFDGNIYIYSNDLYAKKDLKQVSVQVKGKSSVSKTIKQTIKYPISVVDLNIYMNNGGTMFFVVYIDTNSREVKQIYYSSLLPIKIKELLKLHKDKSDTIKVKFNQFPTDIVEITDVFLNFYSNAQKQISFVGKETPTIEELEKSNRLDSISFEYIRSIGKQVSENEIPKLLENKEMYVYANVKDGVLPIPVEYYANMDNITMSTDEMRPVSVNNNKYYDSMNKTISAEKITYKIGTCVTFSVPNIPATEIREKGFSVNFTIAIKGTLSQRIKGLEFIISMFEAKKFEIGGVEFPVNFSGKEIDKLNPSQYPHIIQNLKKARKVLESLNVTKDLDFDMCTDDDIKRLNTLIKAFEDGSSISGLGKDIPLVTKYTIGNIELALVFVKNSDETYNIWNLFDTYFPVVQEVNDKKTPTSQFTILTADEFVTLDNVNYKNIIEDFYRIDVSEVLINSANKIMLELIKAFDIRQDRIYLDTAKQLLDLQKDHPEFITSTICHLNELQILLRERPINFAEKKKLYEIIENSKECNIQAGAYLLLDEQEEATKIFETLTEKQLNEFKEYPIYKFYHTNQ